MNFKSLFLSAAAVLLSVAATTSCTQKVQENDTLSVEPSSAIEFEAKDNEAVRLTVTTTASEWNYTAPEWIEAQKEGNVLVVNAKENTTNEQENSGISSCTCNGLFSRYADRLLRQKRR